MNDIKDPNIKQTAQLLNVDNLWIGNKDVNSFYHNKVSALNFLNSWDTATKESEVPNILQASHTSITSEL